MGRPPGRGDGRGHRLHDAVGGALRRPHRDREPRLLRASTVSTPAQRSGDLGASSLLPAGDDDAVRGRPRGGRRRRRVALDPRRCEAPSRCRSEPPPRGPSRDLRSRHGRPHARPEALHATLTVQAVQLRGRGAGDLLGAGGRPANGWRAAARHADVSTRPADVHRTPRTSATPLRCCWEEDKPQALQASGTGASSIRPPRPTSDRDQRAPGSDRGSGANGPPTRGPRHGSGAGGPPYGGIGSPRGPSSTVGR